MWISLNIIRNSTVEESLQNLIYSQVSRKTAFLLHVIPAEHSDRGISPYPHQFPNSSQIRFSYLYHCEKDPTRKFLRIHIWSRTGRKAYYLDLKCRRAAFHCRL